LGTILFRSPTTPRSANSKIGAFASLLFATMFSDRRGARIPAGVDAGAGRGDSGVAAERLGEPLHQLEPLGLAEPAPAGDEDVGALDIDIGPALLPARDHLRPV